MSSKNLFNEVHKPRSTRMVDGFDSVVFSNLAIGYVAGFCRQLPALMSDIATDESVWRIVNLKSLDQDKKNVFDAVAVLGAIDNDQASVWAIQQHGRFFDAVVTDVQESSHYGLKRHLDCPAYHQYISPLRASDLANMQDVVTGQKVLWDGIELKSHGGSTANLLLDIVRNDDYGLLFDSLSKDKMSCWLGSLGIEPEGYDALIVQNNQLDRLMSRLSAAMARATEAGVQVTNVTQSQPFKKNKVTQVAVVFELSDGQSVSIIFHNPDATPTKLLPSDTLISWKWLLNGRDVSAAVQPNQGEDVQLPILAVRIMKLVNKNSARFTRTIAKKDENLQAIADTQARIDQKNEAVTALDNEIATLHAQLDAPAVIDPVVQPPESVQDIPYSEKIINILVADYGWAKSTLSGGIEKAFENLGADGDIANGARILHADFDSTGRWLAVTDAAADTGGKIIPETEIDERDFAYKPEEGAKAFNDKVDAFVSSIRNDLAEEEQPQNTSESSSIEDLGEGHYKAYKNAKKIDFWTVWKLGDSWLISANNAATRAWSRGIGKPRHFDTLEALIQAYPAFSDLPNLLIAKGELAALPTPSVEENPPEIPSNADVDYLNSLINETVDFTDGDAIEYNLNEISTRLDDSTNDLFEQAADVYSRWALAQAASLEGATYS